MCASVPAGLIATFQELKNDAIACQMYLPARVLPARCIACQGCSFVFVPALVEVHPLFTRSRGQNVGRRTFSAFPGPAGVLDEVDRCVTRAYRSIRCTRTSPRSEPSQYVSVPVLYWTGNARHLSTLDYPWF